ncbi:MAG: HlyD family type I secretion periplasmic adaptor subunit [Burkholderiaceae bacterium]|jgi:hemolysin D|nr:HlyD family type I secretion periplasmic adaptor subunit [Burkholderiaceae bacterium]
MEFMKLQGLRQLGGRYWAIWRSVWAIRKDLELPKRDADQRAFLPAELELLETPVHPAPRWAVRTLILMTFVALLIGVFGRLDIVVAAQGAFIPGVRVKVIQPAITGVVREILVREGQRVEAGQLLMRLDTTQAAADTDKARSIKLDAMLAAARADALLAAQHTGKPPVVTSVEGASPERLQAAQRLAESAWSEYRDQIDSAQAELRKRQAVLESTRAEIAKLEQTAPLARQQADAFQGLVADRYVARNEYLAKEQDALGKENDLTAQRSRANELAAGIAEQRANLEAAASKFRRSQLDDLEKGTQQITQGRNDEIRAQTRQELLSLRAPVAGTVQKLAVHTLGGVVTTAQSIMEIVPDDVLEIEAQLANKDVGFVQVGQRVAVKVEAFPYSRYGYLNGTVTAVSIDAVRDRRQGMTFPVRIRVSTNRIRVDNRWIRLTPGMAVTADIRTGSRSVIGYFLDPLRVSLQESMHER